MVTKAVDLTLKSEQKKTGDEKKKWEKQVDELKKKLKEAGDENIILKKKLEEASSLEKEKSIVRQNSSKRDLKLKADAVIDKEKYEEKIRKLEETALKSDKLIKEYRFKL